MDTLRITVVSVSEARKVQWPYGKPGIPGPMPVAAVQ